MTELSAAKLADLRETAGKATPGPWQIDADDPGPLGSIVSTFNDHPFGWVEVAKSIGDDAPYIAAFDPPTVLALLDRIEEQQAELAKVREYAEAMVSNDMSGWDLMAKLVGDGSVHCARGILAILAGDGDE